MARGHVEGVDGLKPGLSRTFSLLDEELKVLQNLKCVLALGKLAFDCYQKILKEEGVITSMTPFKHGAHVAGGCLPNLVGSYHPSPQNTHTGLLTDEMLVHLLRRLMAKTSFKNKCS